LAEKNLNVVIFGYTGLGTVILNALKEFNITVMCFCDNSPPNTESWQGLPCIKPEDAIIKYPKSIFIYSAVEPSTCRKMNEQLMSLNSGVLGCFWDIALYSYIVAKRNIDKIMFANTLYHFWEQEPSDGILINSLSFRITNRCTLKCKECAFLVPYHRNHYDFPIDNLISSLEALCRKIDGLLDLTINGGETFLYSALVVLLKKIVSISNIVNIVIVTNGTIIPSDEVLKLCADNAIRIRVSNYGMHSDKIDAFYERCKTFNVSVSEFQHAKMWYKIGTTKHNRTNEENRKVANNCPFNCGKNKRLLGIFNRGLHLCDRYDGLYSCGHVSDDSIDGIHFDLTANFTRKDLSDFLKSKSLYNLCDYCNYPMEEILPGEQLC